VQWTVKKGGTGSGITCTDYKKSKEEVELDQELEEKMSSLTVECNRRFADASRHKETGNEHIKAKRYEQALGEYATGLQMMQLSRQASVIMSQRLQEMNRQLQVDLHNNAALAMLKLDDGKGAVLHANEALQIDERNTKALYRRGLAQVQQGSQENATADFRKVLEIDPRNNDAKLQLKKLNADA